MTDDGKDGITLIYTRNNKTFTMKLDGTDLDMTDYKLFFMTFLKQATFHDQLIEDYFGDYDSTVVDYVDWKQQQESIKDSKLKHEELRHDYAVVDRENIDDDF